MMRTDSSPTVHPARISDGRRRAAGVLLLFTSCLPLLGATLLTPTLATIAGDFRDERMVGLLVPLIVTAPGAVIALIAPFAGSISDRLGRKRLLLAATFCYGLLGVAPVLLGDLLSIVASRILLGVCEAVLMTVCTALLADYFVGRQRVHYLSLQTVFTSLSAVIFVVIGGAAAQGDWRAPFWIYVVGVVLAVPILFVIWEPLASGLDPSRNDHHGAAAATTPGTAPGTHRRHLLKPFPFTLMTGMAANIMLISASFVLPARGFTANTGAIGLVTAALSVGSALSAQSFRYLARFGPRALLAAAYLVQAGGLAGVASAPTAPVIIISGFFAHLGFGLQLPTLITWALSGLSDVNTQGVASGWWTSAFWGGQFLFSFVFTALSSVSGGMFTAIAIFAVLVFVAGVLALVVVPRGVSLLDGAAAASTTGCH